MSTKEIESKGREGSGSPMGYPAQLEATRTSRSKRAAVSAQAVSAAKIESAARQLKILKNRQENLQQEIDQLETDLKSQLEAWNVEEVQAGPFRVVWKLVNSSRFDSKSFRAKYGKLYDKYTIPNSYRKFLVV